MTNAQGLRLLALCHEMKQVAIPVGAMHAWWDDIFDIDAFVKGKSTVVSRTAEEWIAHAESLLASRNAG